MRRISAAKAREKSKQKLPKDGLKTVDKIIFKGGIVGRRESKMMRQEVGAGLTFARCLFQTISASESGVDQVLGRCLIRCWSDAVFLRPNRLMGGRLERWRTEVPERWSF